jgi:hypothetical protein
MTFFVRYNGTMHAGLVRLEVLAWILIYGGLLGGLVGAWMVRTQQGGGLLLGAGVLAVVLGIVVIYVRSRMGDDPVKASDPRSR